MKTEDLNALIAKCVREEFLKKQAEDQSEIEKKLRERWTTHFDQQEKKIEELINEAKARGAALDQIMEKEGVIKTWNWKRITWAGIAGAIGGTVAWLLHFRCPALNQAAGGMTGGLVMQELGLRGQIPSFGAAVGSIATIWATDNMPLAAMSMAGVAYGKVMFDIGEDIHDAFMVRVKRAQLLPTAEAGDIRCAKTV